METFRCQASGFATAILEEQWVFPPGPGTLPFGLACEITHSFMRTFTPATTVPKLNTSSVMDVEICVLETETQPVASEIHVFCRATLHVLGWDSSGLATQWPVWKQLYVIWNRIRIVELSCISRNTNPTVRFLRTFWLYTTVTITWTRLGCIYCLTQLSGGYIYIYIYIIYYIENNYMFRRLIMAIFRLYMKHLVSSYTKHIYGLLIVVGRG